MRSAKETIQTKSIGWTVAVLVPSVFLSLSSSSSSPIFAAAWSIPNFPQHEFKQISLTSMDRRTAMNRILSLTAKGGVGSASVMAYLNIVQPADAESLDPNSDNPPPAPSQSTFTAYNIIPDQSASLDPTLIPLKGDKLFSTLAASDAIKSGGAIWLGEHHNSVRDHDFQASFIQNIYQIRNKQQRQEENGAVVPPMAIGLEQVQNQFQPALDDFVGGRITLNEMRERVEWDKRWTWNFDGYKVVFETARDLGIRLLALNVDSEDLVQVEKGGFPGLPMDRLKKYIQDPVKFGEFAKARQFSTYVECVIKPSYEVHQRLGLLRNTMGGEPLDEEMSFRNFLSGRILWDEGMAFAAYKWNIQNPGGLLVGLVGADHVKFRNGIPGRFSRMAGDKFDSASIIINPTLIDTRPSGSVATIPGSDSYLDPDRFTLQLRYLKDGVDPSSESRSLPESTGGVLPFADYIVIS